MAVVGIEAVLAVFKEALQLWRTHLEKRKELYELFLQKKKDKALNSAEMAIGAGEELIAFVLGSVPLNDDHRKEINRLNKNFQNLKKRFNELD